ncbi:MAG: hypothetical protein A2845_01120 [Candidatus Lloydbacteria bacterium RIFCSPHIGHO2_01_FULL_49_22]|uniref:DUF4349 domain-containing protein n=1 Tax=Candidatus Lloydbacteria bacterium RIFCSPHIGHO2_01_FULL_49_22 TaxID=1798658 RepID=A0A1G2CWJ8_9BACT|nr:MAG: hypothetical protein A2845_01120 [Candidatus Lloydbacteria bacterium RIFCSPHIGHO2_01_FULL_49_22]OGZ09225.1 MAG: hypothetical protein A3C14_06125 [Candidatus Lloydbacteria bacterium RIFCSPHIGHO2_02_FULL_50_18]
MDLSKIRNMSAKSIFLFVGFAIIALVVLWGLMGYSQSQLGLSGSVTSYSQPLLAPGMMGDVSYRENAKGVAYDAVVTNGVSQIMPSPIRETSAPAGTSKIIKNGELELLVEDVDIAAKEIDAVRMEFGGQIGNASFSDYSSSRRGDLTIWVPSEHFDGALEKIKALGLRVTSERIAVSDVSAQFVDLEARLKNLHATEAQYLEIMKRSGSIPDVLSVTRELSLTRAQIEQLQGQLDYLSRQVALSSIHISLTEEIAAALGKNEWRPMSVVRAAWREMVLDLTDFINVILVLVVKLPLLLLKFAFWGSIIYAVWRFGRFVYLRLRGPALS